MKYSIDHELLKKFISGKCTPEEAEQVRKFLLRPENSDELEKILDDQWNCFEAEQPSVSVMNEWQSEFERRKKNLAVDVERRRNRGNIRKWSYIATAACLIPILFFITFHSVQKKGEYNHLIRATLAEVRTSAGETSELTLPDGTTVFIGPKSRLGYPEKFDGAMREVSLEGEAFFDVVKNPEQPFVIVSGEISTRVLGTSFKVEAYSGSPASVSVVTGKVRVARREQEKTGKELAVLTPGKQVKYDSVSETAEVSDFNILDVSQWKEGHLMFRSVAVKDVLRNLERWYDVRITVENPGWEDKKIQLVVNGKAPVTEALETIRQITGLNYRIKDGEIIMYEQSKQNHQR